MEVIYNNCETSEFEGKMRTRLNGSKMSPFLSLRGRAEAISNNEIPRSNRPRNDILGVFSTEKGIALVMVLILSAIILAIMSGLVYMVISGTQISGIQKRYKTALEAGIGGANVSYQLIGLEGDTTKTNTFLSDISALSPAVTTPNACTGISKESVTYTGLSAKLRTPTSTWVNCDSSLTITPGTTSTYDITFQLGIGPTYTVYSKIVDTVEGNSGGDEGLLKTGVVVSNPGEVSVKSIPYLYTIEIDSENVANQAERAKLSVLYQY